MRSPRRRPKLRPIRADEVIGSYGDGERDFRYVDLRGQDLSDANLEGASFIGACLAGTNFSGAWMTHVQLKSANLKAACLAKAVLNATDLIAADFSAANLTGADLTGAALSSAALVGANLQGAVLGGAVLTQADIAGANFSNAHLFHTNLCDLDVSILCGETSLRHVGPSHLDARTVLRSQQHPSLKQFMIDCGVPEIFAEFMLDCARASHFGLLSVLMQSTFISYGGPDESFARMLYEALKAHKVVTFFFPETAMVGERINNEVYRQLQDHDRVILVCSRQSLDRPGVINEIQETLDRETRDSGATYLLPITLDDYVFDGWKTTQPVFAERIGRRIVADFRETERNRTKFDQAVGRLLQALKKKRPKVASGA